MIDTCPRCRYSLTGLPEKHKCPECGLDYDRDSVVVKEARWLWVLFMILFGLTFVALTALLAWHDLLLSWHAIGLLGVVLPSVGAAWRLRKPKSMVVISNSNVRIFKNPEEDEKVVPLSEIDSAEWNWVNGNVEVVGKDGSFLARIRPELLSSNRRSKRVAAEISQRVAGDGGPA